MQAHLYPETTIDKAKRLLGALIMVMGTFLMGTATMQSIIDFSSGELANEIECI